MSAASEVAMEEEDLDEEAETGAHNQAGQFLCNQDIRCPLCPPLHRPYSGNAAVITHLLRSDIHKKKSAAVLKCQACNERIICYQEDGDDSPYGTIGQFLTHQAACTKGGHDFYTLPHHQILFSTRNTLTKHARIGCPVCTDREPDCEVRIRKSVLFKRPPDGGASVETELKFRKGTGEHNSVEAARVNARKRQSKMTATVRKEPKH